MNFIFYFTPTFNYGGHFAQANGVYATTLNKCISWLVCLFSKVDCR